MSPSLRVASRRRLHRLARMLAAAGALAWPLATLAAPGDDESVLIVMLREEAAELEQAAPAEREGTRVVALYCEAARLGDVESQFRLGWIHANGTLVERNDTLAAFFFQIAAEQGLEPARRMLQVVGGPTEEVPACMREPAAPVVAKAAPAAPPRVAAAAAVATRIAAPQHIAQLVARMAPEYRVEPQLALAIIQAESNFDPAAVSPKNAKGLMQLIPETAARFNVRNPYDAAQNIRGGLAYLRWLLAYFEGDVRLVAAAYNAGEGAVERYRGVPPYLETRAYVRRILSSVGEAVHPFDASVTRPSPQLPRMRPLGRG